VEWVEEESYFFKLSAFADKLLALYDNGQDFVLPASRLNEVRSFVKGGLKDLSISRTTFDWGVKVPNDDKHIMYVWIDALTNYLTATGWPDESGKYATHWKEAVHVVGKDIVRFHAVYWPAFLMAADLPLPKRVVAHGWWTIEGEKMSKSIGNVLSPQEMITAAGGVDQLRYFMLKAMPFGNDGDFSKDRMIETINADLANNIGNLAQRTLSMIQKNCGGVVPEFFNVQDDEMQIIDLSRSRLKSLMPVFMEDFDYLEALNAIIRAAGASNLYIDKKAPWQLKKSDERMMQNVLYFLAESVRGIAIALQPFCPNAASKLLDQLVVPANERTLAHLTMEFSLKPGTPLPAPEGVFPRLQPTEQKGAA
jgi:methionyl-tRNA synthetase